MDKSVIPIAENLQSTSLNRVRVDNITTLGSFNQVSKSDLSASKKQISKTPVSAVKNGSKANSSVVNLLNDSETQEDTKNTTPKSLIGDKKDTSCRLEPRATRSQNRAECGVKQLNDTKMSDGKKERESLRQQSGEHQIDETHLIDDDLLDIDQIKVEPLSFVQDEIQTQTPSKMIRSSLQRLRLSNPGDNLLTNNKVNSKETSNQMVEEISVRPDYKSLLGKTKDDVSLNIIGCRDACLLRIDSETFQQNTYDDKILKQKGVTEIKTSSIRPIDNRNDSTFFSHTNQLVNKIKKPFDMKFASEQINKTNDIQVSNTNVNKPNRFNSSHNVVKLIDSSCSLPADEVIIIDDDDDININKDDRPTMDTVEETKESKTTNQGVNHLKESFCQSEEIYDDQSTTVSVSEIPVLRKNREDNERKLKLQEKMKMEEERKRLEKIEKEKEMIKKKINKKHSEFCVGFSDNNHLVIINNIKVEIDECDDDILEETENQRVVDTEIQGSKEAEKQRTDEIIYGKVKEAESKRVKDVELERFKNERIKNKAKEVEKKNPLQEVHQRSVNLIKQQDIKPRNKTSQNVPKSCSPIKEVESPAKRPRRSLRLIERRRKNDSVNKMLIVTNSGAAIIPKETVGTKTIVSTSIDPDHQTTRSKSLRSVKNFIKQQEIEPTQKPPAKKRGRKRRIDVQNRKQELDSRNKTSQNVAKSSTSVKEVEPPAKRPRTSLRLIERRRKNDSVNNYAQPRSTTVEPRQYKKQSVEKSNENNETCKRLMKFVFNNLCEKSKYISTLNKEVTGIPSPYDAVIKCPVKSRDIRRKIAAGEIKNLAELQLNLLILSYNALMINKSDTTVFSDATNFQFDLRENCLELKYAVGAHYSIRKNGRMKNDYSINDMRFPDLHYDPCNNNIIINKETINDILHTYTDHTSDKSTDSDDSDTPPPKKKRKKKPFGFFQFRK